MLAINAPIPGAPNFTLGELCKSTTAYQKGIYNIAAGEQVENLVYLATKVLQPLREYFGEPIIVTSGYRSPALNKAVNGSATSFHSIGCAADIQFGPNSKHKLIELFGYIHGYLPFTELIAEELPQGWIHVAIQKGRDNEKQTKYKRRGEVAVHRASYAEIIKIMG